MLGLQPRALRTVTDDDLAALPRHLQERVDILLDRHPADVGGDRPREVQEGLVTRPEQLGIDAASPRGEVAESPVGQFAAHRRGTDHATDCLAVEPAQHPVGQADRDRVAGTQVLRELGMVGRREREAMADAVAAGGEAQRALGCDVDGLRLEFTDPGGDFRPRQQREADFRVGRARKAAEFVRRHHRDVVAEAAQGRCGLAQRADDAVGLRQPRVGDDHDSHSAAPIGAERWHPFVTFM